MATQEYTYVDEEAIDEDLLCKYICFQPLDDPVVHNSCGNSFCRSCIEKLDFKCPTCRTGAVAEYSKTNIRAFHNQLSKIQVICNSCEKQMQRGDFKHHKPCFPRIDIPRPIIQLPSPPIIPVQTSRQCRIPSVTLLFALILVLFVLNFSARSEGVQLELPLECSGCSYFYIQPANVILFSWQFKHNQYIYLPVEQVDAVDSTKKYVLRSNLFNKYVKSRYTLEQLLGDYPIDWESTFLLDGFDFTPQYNKLSFIAALLLQKNANNVALDILLEASKKTNLSIPATVKKIIKLADKPWYRRLYDQMAGIKL